MSQLSQQNSPTYQSTPPGKGSRLYQQLLNNNYLHDHLYSPSHDQPASIKFTNPSSLPHYHQPSNSSELEQSSSKSSSKYNNPFKTFESAKNSHQATQSLGSNYSIIEMDNESYSTLNLYSLSRNVQHDHSLSSNNITQKLNHDDTVTVPIIPEESKHTDLMLEGSTNRQAPTVQEVSCLEGQQRMKKYRSQQFGIAMLQDQEPIAEQDSGEQSPLPRLLADKYIKNDFNRKFSTEHQSNNEETNFKPVLNEIYVVPYKINEQVQPYAFSVPAAIPPPQPARQNPVVERRANSLTLNTSRRSQVNEEQKGKTHLYFSNHTHLQQNRQKTYIHNHNTPTTTQEQKQQSRPVQKSQPKPYHYSNEKTARSNSIDCKSKPLIAGHKVAEISNPQIPSEQLDHSRVMRVFKQEDRDKDRSMENRRIPIENSIIYDESQINLCCGMTMKSKEKYQEKPKQRESEKKEGNANKINFKSDANNKNSFFTEPIPPYNESNISKKGPNYKICSLSMIKSKNEGSSQGEQPKKGIKLLGYNPSFPRKAEE